MAEHTRMTSLEELEEELLWVNVCIESLSEQNPDALDFDTRMPELLSQKEALEQRLGALKSDGTSTPVSQHDIDLPASALGPGSSPGIPLRLWRPVASIMQMDGPADTPDGSTSPSSTTPSLPRSFTSSLKRDFNQSIDLKDIPEANKSRRTSPNPAKTTFGNSDPGHGPGALSRSSHTDRAAARQKALFKSAEERTAQKNQDEQLARSLAEADISRFNGDATSSTGASAAANGQQNGNNAAGSASSFLPSLRESSSLGSTPGTNAHQLPDIAQPPVGSPYHSIPPSPFATNTVISAPPAQHTVGNGLTLTAPNGHPVKQRYGNATNRPDPFEDLNSHYVSPWARVGGHPQLATPQPQTVGADQSRVSHSNGVGMPGAFPSTALGPAVAANGHSHPLGIRPATTANGEVLDGDPLNARSDLDYMYFDSTKTEEEMQRLLENIRPDEDVPPELRQGTPEAFRRPLMEHQKIGLAWLMKQEESSNKGGILADDMGFGKTIQALALMVSRKSEDPKCKTNLIVAPVALLHQWKEEIEDKLKGPPHSLSVFIYHGNMISRKSYEDLAKYDVVLTTYGCLATEYGARVQMQRDNTGRDNVDWNRLLGKDTFTITGYGSKWYRIILDEAQNVKNDDTKSSHGACLVAAKYRWCLTGTPMMNNAKEIYSLILFLRIRPYCDKSVYRRDFGVLFKAGSSKSQYVIDKAMQKFHALLKVVLLRRDKTAKLDGNFIINLPPRIVNVEDIALDEDELGTYNALEAKTKLQINKYFKAGQLGKRYHHALVLLLRLRQCCCHPHLIRDFSPATDVPVADMLKWAADLSEDVVDTIKEEDGAFACFSCHDAAEGTVFFHPCGHSTCAECFKQIASSARNTQEDGAKKLSKCRECDAIINPRHVFDYATFKQVHMEGPAAEGADGGEDDESDADSESSDDDSEEEDDSLGGFIVADGEEEDEYEADDSASDEDVKKPFGRRSPNKSAAKPKKALRRRSKPARKNGELKDKYKTLGQLAAASRKSRSAKRKYLNRLREDFVSSSKIERTMELLYDVLENDPTEKTIIFSQFTSLLDLLEIPLLEGGWKYLRYDGSMSLNERHDVTTRFTENRVHNVMLISLKSGNAGLNLTRASRVILLDPYWNPTTEDQAIDRTHRIGQKRTVNVHRLLTHETVEDRIIELQRNKKDFINAALDGEAHTSVTKLGSSELMFLFGLRGRT